MATADELLMGAAVAETDKSSETTSSEEILVVDLNARVISIPASIKILGVESDDDVKRLQFNIPRHYGEFDLSTFKIQINFENARNKGDIYPVKDLMTNDDNTISFTWLVDRVAYDYAGDVKFSICMKLYDETGIVIKELNTTYATLPVLEGLETEKSVVEQNPSAFDQVMYRLYAVEAATGNGQNGYYSVVKVDQADTGVLFTIVNQDGESVAYVRHGNDGRTPVKGEDYWTIEDKTEISEYAKTIVNGWAPVYTTAVLIGGADAWSNNEQTISIDCITKSSIVFVSPTPNDNSYANYASYGVRCVSQNDRSLTFNCRTVPSDNVTVILAIYNGLSESNWSNVSVIDDGEGNVTIL